MKTFVLIFLGALALMFTVLCADAQVNVQAGARFASRHIAVWRPGRELPTTGLLASTASPGSSARTYSKAGDASMPAVTEKISAARVEVFGQASLAYTVTFPPTYMVNRNGNFVTGRLNIDPPGPGLITNIKGEQTISVDATINMASSPGYYTNVLPLAVTINYN